MTAAMDAEAEVIEALSPPFSFRKAIKRAARSATAELRTTTPLRARCRAVRRCRYHVFKTMPPLAAAGVPIWVDDQARIAHEKAMVIDETVTLTECYNWTRGAAENSEHLNLEPDRECGNPSVSRSARRSGSGCFTYKAQQNAAAPQPCRRPGEPPARSE